MPLYSLHSSLAFSLSAKDFTYFYMFLIPAVGIYGLINYRKLSGFNKLVVQITLFSGFVQDYMLLPFDWVTTNLPLFHLLAIAFTIYFGLIYKKLFPKASVTGKAILYVSIIFAVVETFNSFVYQGLHSFPSFNIMLVAVLTIVSSLLYFRHLLRFPSEQNILNFPPFWFVSGNLFFYAMNFCFLTFRYYFEMAGYANSYDYYLEYYVLTSGIIIQYLAYLISFIKDMKAKKAIN